MKSLPSGSQRVYVSAAPSVEVVVKHLNEAISVADPLRFFLYEDMTISYYKSRVPQWRPTRPQDWSDIVERRRTLNDIKRMIEQQHRNLFQAVMNAQVNRVAFDADLARREMEWIEELKKRQDTRDQDLDFRQAMAALSEQAELVRDRRAHNYAKELIEIEHAHQERMRRIGNPTGSEKMADVVNVNEQVATILRNIQNSGDTNRIKSQRALSIIDVSTKILS